MATVRGVPLPDCNSSSSGPVDPCCPAEVTALSAIQAQTTGLATAANQNTQTTALSAIQAQTTGLATAANQTTQITAADLTNTTLSHIDNDLHTIKVVLDALNINTDQLEPLTSATNSAIATLNTYVDQVETLLATLGANTDQIEALMTSVGLNTDQVETLLISANTALGNILNKLGEACNASPINVNVCNSTDPSALLQSIADNTDQLEALLAAIGDNTDQVETLLTSANTALVSILNKLSEACNASPINVNVCNSTDPTVLLQSIADNTDQLETLLTALDTNTDQVETLLTSTNTALGNILNKLSEACNASPINVNVCNSTDPTALLQSIADNTDQLEALLTAIGANQVAQTVLITHIDGDLHLANAALGTPADAVATAPFSAAYSEISLLKAIAANGAPLPQGVHTGATEAGNAVYTSDATIGDTTNAAATIGGTASAPTVGNVTLESLMKLLVLQNAKFPTVMNGPQRITAGANVVIPANANSVTVSVVLADSSNTVTWTNASGGVAGLVQDAGVTFSHGIDNDSNNLSGSTITANGTAIAYVHWTTQ